MSRHYRVSGRRVEQLVKIYRDTMQIRKRTHIQFTPWRFVLAGKEFEHATSKVSWKKMAFVTFLHGGTFPNKWKGRTFLIRV